MKLLKRLLYEPQHQEEKVTDQALTRSIVISVIGILFCMTCLFGLTWAWFSDSVITSSNKITAATFDLDITVTEQGTENTVSADEDGCYTLRTGETGKTYMVSLAKLGEAKTGFCLLSVKVGDAPSGTPYYTGNIPYVDNSTEATADSYVFYLSIAENTEVQIKFTPMWGQYPEAQEDKVMQYNGTLSLGTAAEVDGEETEQEEPEPEDDLPTKTTTPSTTEPKQTESTAPSTEPTTPENTTGAETTGTPETNAAEPPVTEQPEPTEPSAQTESTEP